MAPHTSTSSTPHPATQPPAPSQQTVRRLHHEPVTFIFSISLHLTISSSTPCISCTISRTRQADAHDSESQFKCDYTSWRGPLRIFFFFRKIPRHANKHSRRGKKCSIRKTRQKNEIKSGSLTFVVIHRFGVHGKCSHYQTHVDFCLQTGCVGACEFVRACV